MNAFQSPHDYEEYVYTLKQPLASTYPHHKHVPPDIKRHRVPAPGMSFTQPNLPLLILEIEAILVASPSNPSSANIEEPKVDENHQTRNLPGQTPLAFFEDTHR